MLNNCISQSLAITRYFRHYQHGLIAAPLLVRQTADLPPAVPRTWKLETTFQMFDWFISPSFGTSFFLLFSKNCDFCFGHCTGSVEKWLHKVFKDGHFPINEIQCLQPTTFLECFNLGYMTWPDQSEVIIVVMWPGLTNQRWLLWSCDLVCPIRGQVVELLTRTSLENNLKSVSNVASLYRRTYHGLVCN